jgi:signal transduction histidine kinase
MEAVGQLTGGIAHDFNNLLLVITGNLELLEQQLDGNEHKVLLKEAQDAAILGSKLADRLLTFARRRQMDAQIIPLNDHVVGITDMLRRTLGEQVMLSTSLTRNVWAIRADPNQFQSAIVNMAVNARDAMPQGSKLVIETRNIVLDADHADFHPELQPGQYVQLSISVTGLACRRRFATACSSRSSRLKRRVAARGSAWRCRSRPAAPRDLGSGPWSCNTGT